MKVTKNRICASVTLKNKKSLPDALRTSDDFRKHAPKSILLEHC